MNEAPADRPDLEPSSPESLAKEAADARANVSPDQAPGFFGIDTTPLEVASAERSEPGVASDVGWLVAVEPGAAGTFPGPVLLPVDRVPLWRTFLWIGGGLAGMTAYVGLFFLGGEPAKFATAGLESLPFLVLALLAYAGRRQLWAKILAMLYLGGVVGLTGLVWLALTWTARKDPAALREVLLSVPLAVGLAALCFAAPVRRWAAYFLPLEPNSFVHATALASVVALTVLMVAPLLALGEPPLLLVIKHGPQFHGRAPEVGSLREELYGLAWLVPVAFVAVGFPLVRTLPEARARLGLTWPRQRRIEAALVGVVVLVGAMSALDIGIDLAWQVLGWRTTDERAFAELVRFANSPGGAVIVGLVAGLGEELAVRGVLQPRLGILTSNLFFTALHAPQYNFDALLSVFLMGLVLGVVRKYTDTTTSAVVHGTYDFSLILLGYLGVGGF